ncbi:MAG: hypothetical protein AB4058_01745, partial [Microcystaceae cyanobacterium]
MKAYIVCEEKLDVQLFKQILPSQLLQDVYLVDAGSLYDVTSLACSLVVKRQVPVAIVINADSTHPHLIEERRRSFQDIIESVAINTDLVKVILAIPEIESIFFSDSDLLPKILGQKIPPEILTLAEFQPKKALQKLFPDMNSTDNLIE